MNNLDQARHQLAQVALNRGAAADYLEPCDDEMGARARLAALLNR